MKAPTGLNEGKVRKDSDFVHETSTMSVLNFEDDDEMSVTSNTSSTSFDFFEESKLPQLSDENEDSDCIVFSLSLEKVDFVCATLIQLFQSGKHQIMFKNLNDVTNIMINPKW